jgi:Zn-dependent protease with chaperone function
MALARHWILKLTAIPAGALVAFMLSVFSRSEARISRERELEADRASLEVASARAIGLALVKSAAFVPLWVPCLVENADRWRMGNAATNLSIAFVDLVRRRLDKEYLAARMDEILQTRIAHPTDSHPTVSERLVAICGNVPRYEVSDLWGSTDRAAAALGNLDDVEKELTDELNGALGLWRHRPSTPLAGRW